MLNGWYHMNQAVGLSLTNVCVAERLWLIWNGSQESVQFFLELGELNSSHISNTFGLHVEQLRTIDAQTTLTERCYAC